MRFLLALTLTFFLLAGAGCDGIHEGLYTHGLKTRPNVVIISVESLRADRVNEKLTPNLIDLAEKGIYFDRAYSTSSWALPAVASVFTGLYPVHHGLEKARLKNGQLTIDRLNHNHETLAEILGGFEYSTYGFSTNGRLDRLIGFDQGIGRFDCIDGGSSRTNEAWLSKMLPYMEADIKSKKPYFLWLHYSDPRYPYLPRKPFVDRLLPDWENRVDRLIVHDPIALARQGVLAKDKELLSILDGLYDSEVAAVDAGIAKAISILPGMENTLIVLLGTNGEALGNRGNLGNGDNLRTSLISVPLMLIAPRGAKNGQKLDTPVSLVDLMPTILNMVDVPCPANLDGLDILSLPNAPEMVTRPVFASLCRPRVEYRGVIMGQNKLVEKIPGKNVSLFNIVWDSQEKKNLSPDNLHRVGEWTNILAGHAASNHVFQSESESRKVNFETMRHLLAVGYLR